MTKKKRRVFCFIFPLVTLIKQLNKYPFTSKRENKKLKLRFLIDRIYRSDQISIKIATIVKQTTTTTNLSMSRSINQSINQSDSYTINNTNTNIIKKI